MTYTNNPYQTAIDVLAVAVAERQHKIRGASLIARVRQKELSIVIDLEREIEELQIAMNALRILHVLSLIPHMRKR